jgi:hypothetical protein
MAKGTRLVILLAVLVAGCAHRTQTDQFIVAGRAAGAELQSYYERLADTTLDAWQYQTAFDTLQGISTNQETERLFAERLAALRDRATMAARLGGFYEAVGRLRDPKISQPAVTASQNLAKSLGGLPGLPGGAALGGGLGEAANLLTGIGRAHSFRQANAAVTKALEGIRDLFAREREAYLSINRDRDQTRHELLASLARRKMVNTAGLLDKLRLGVTWINPSENEAARALALNVDRISAQRSSVAWSCATEETAGLLALLVAGHEGFAEGAAPDSIPLERAEARAGACLATHKGVYP